MMFRRGGHLPLDATTKTHVGIPNKVIEYSEPRSVDSQTVIIFRSYLPNLQRSTIKIVREDYLRQVSTTDEWKVMMFVVTSNVKGHHVDWTVVNKTELLEGVRECWGVLNN